MPHISYSLLKSCLIEKSMKITGIKIGNNMYKFSQFVDDTTIILDGTSKSLQAILNILEDIW